MHALHSLLWTKGFDSLGGQKLNSLKSEIELGAAAASIHHVACFALLCLHGKARTLHAYRRHHAFSRYLWPERRSNPVGRPVCLAMMQRTYYPAGPIIMSSVC
jgi:hypothetical protein